MGVSKNKDINIYVQMGVTINKDIYICTDGCHYKQGYTYMYRWVSLKTNFG